MVVIREDYKTVKELLEPFEGANEMVLCLTAATPPGAMWFCHRMACNESEWTTTILAHPNCAVHKEQMTLGVWRPLILLIDLPNVTLSQP